MPWGIIFFSLQVRIRTLPDKVTIRELHKHNHKKQKLLKLKKKKKYVYATKFRKSKAALGGAGGSFGLKLPKFMNKHIWRAQHRQHQKPILSNEIIGKEIYLFIFRAFLFLKQDILFQTTTSVVALTIRVWSGTDRSEN